MSSLLILILYISLSIVSSEGRHLRVHVDRSSKPLPPSYKNAEEIKLEEITPKYSMKPLETPSKEAVGAVDRSKTLEVSQKDEADRKGGSVLSSGSGNSRAFSHDGLPQIIQSKVRLGRQVLSMLGFESNEEHSSSKETTTVEELVAMDYVGAQRGPSIHN